MSRLLCSLATSTRESVNNARLAFMIALGVSIYRYMCIHKKTKRSLPQIIATDFFMKINNPGSWQKLR